MAIEASSNRNSSIHLALGTPQATIKAAVSSKNLGSPGLQSAQRTNSQNQSVQTILPSSTVNTLSTKTEINALEENLKPEQLKKFQNLKKGGNFVMHYKAGGELYTLLKLKDDMGNPLPSEHLYELATETRKDDGSTPAHREAKTSSGSILATLMNRLEPEQGKKILGLKDKNGKTPLDYLLPQELGTLISLSIDRLKEGGDINLRRSAMQTIEVATEKLSSDQLYEVLKLSYRQLYEVLTKISGGKIYDDCCPRLIHEVVKTGDVGMIDYFTKRLTFQHVNDLGKLSENDYLKHDETILHIAAAEKNGPEIIECITQNFPPEQKNKLLTTEKYKYDYESTLMQAAIKIGSIETVGYLLTQMKPQQLEEFIKPEKYRKTLLDTFTPEQLGSLLKFKDEQGYTLLHRMARENSSKVIEYFTKELPLDDLYELVTLQGPDGSTPVQAAAKIREIETTSIPIEATNNIETIETAKVTVTIETVETTVAIETIEPPIDSLIKGLKLQQRQELLNLREKDGQTPLNYLVQSNNFEMVERLMGGMASEQQQEIRNPKAQLTN